MLGVAAVGLALDVASMGPGESVQEHYLGCMLAGSQHHAAMQRLEGRERQEDIHRPVAVGGGSRPPQERAGSSTS